MNIIYCKLKKLKQKDEHPSSPLLQSQFNSLNTESFTHTRWYRVARVDIISIWFFSAKPLSSGRTPPFKKRNKILKPKNKVEQTLRKGDMIKNSASEKTEQI